MGRGGARGGATAKGMLVCVCVRREEEKGGYEYKTQTTVPLAAALWGREMESDDTRVGGMLEAMISLISGER